MRFTSRTPYPVLVPLVYPILPLPASAVDGLEGVWHSKRQDVCATLSADPVFVLDLRNVESPLALVTRLWCERRLFGNSEDWNPSTPTSPFFRDTIEHNCLGGSKCQAG